MAKVFKVQVDSCSKCPNMTSNRHYTADSFEFVFEWSCGAVRNKHICYHEFPDKEPAIPEWCPLDGE